MTLSKDATFSQHITVRCDRCELVKSKIAWILKTFQSRHCLPVLTLWKTLLVLSHLDYCSKLWSPSNVGNIQRPELLQKAFVFRIEGMSCLSYWEQLRQLNHLSAAEIIIRSSTPGESSKAKSPTSSLPRLR